MIKESKIFLVIFGIYAFLTFNVKAEDAFFYYDKNIRKSVISSIHKDLKLNYSLWEIKQNTIRGFNPDRIFLEANKQEDTKNQAKTNSKKAQENLAFFDKIRAILSKFQDSHLKFKAMVTTPIIFNGLKIKKIGEKYFVVAINEKILQYTKKNYNKKNINIELGDELIKIDDIDIAKVVSNLEQYVPASSKLAASNKATDAITRRDFSYPKKAFENYTFQKVNTGLIYTKEIPYYHQPHNRSDFKYYFKEISLTSLEDLKLTWNTKNKKWNKIQFNQIKGFDQYQIPKDMIGSKTYMKDASKIPAIRTGFLIENNRAFGVLQIFTFGAKKVSLALQKKVDFFTPIISFISYLKKTKTPLIIDLRYNGGGNGAFPRQLLSHITEKNKKYNATTWMFKKTPSIQQMFEVLETPKKEQKSFEDPINKTTIEALKIARNNQQKFLGPFTKIDLITKSKEINGYHEKVVVLISERCASACDMFASLVKKSKRGTIIGQPSSGTGAGAKTIGPFDTIDISDDYKLVKISIPNSLFGFPEKINEKDINSGNLNIIKQLCMENAPIHPDIIYQSTLEDFLDYDKGWFQMATNNIKLKQN